MEPPQSFDANRANKIRFEMDPVAEKCLALTDRIVEIDETALETIKINTELAEIYRERVDSLIDHKNAQVVEEHFQEKIRAFSEQKLKEYQELLVRRSPPVEGVRALDRAEGASSELFRRTLEENRRDFDKAFKKGGQDEKGLREVKAELEEFKQLGQLKTNRFVQQKEKFTRRLLEFLTQHKALAELRQNVIRPQPDTIWKACELGDVEQVKQFFTRGLFGLSCAQINERDAGGKGYTPLEYACYCRQYTSDLHDENPSTEVGRLAVVKFLLDQGAKPSLTNSRGYRAIHWAAKAGMASIIEELLKANPDDLNCKGEYGRTPLHMAVHNGQLEAVRLLIRRKADVNARCDKGEDEITPIFDAIAKGYVAILVELLQVPQIQLQVCNARGIRPLGWAIRYGRDLMVQMIFGHKNWMRPEGSEDPDHLKQLLPLFEDLHEEAFQKLRSWLIHNYGLDPQTKFPRRAQLVPERLVLEDGRLVLQAQSLARNVVFAAETAVSKSASIHTEDHSEAPPPPSRRGTEGANSIQNELRTLANMIFETTDRAALEACLINLGLLWSRSDKPELDSFFLSLSTHIRLLLAPPVQPAAVNNYIFGTYNQFHSLREDGSPWPQDASRASCAMNVLYFFKHVLGNPAVLQNAPPSFVNEIIDQGRGHFEQFVKGVREAKEKLKKDASENEEWLDDIRGDSVNVVDLFPCLPDLQLSSTTLMRPVPPLQADAPDKETTIHYFNTLLQNLQEEVQTSSSHGYTLTCNGSTYGLGVLLSSGGLEFAIFDSHGAPFLNGRRQEAFIFKTKSREEAASFLGKLIKFWHMNVKEPVDSAAAQKISQGYNQIGVSGFIINKLKEGL